MAPAPLSHSVSEQPRVTVPFSFTLFRHTCVADVHSSLKLASFAVDVPHAAWLPSQWRHMGYELHISVSQEMQLGATQVSFVRQPRVTVPSVSRKKKQ